MTRREKIIVGLMCLTVGYGAIELLLPRSRSPLSPPAAAQSGEPLNVFISKVADAIRGGGPGGDVVGEKAKADWTRSPFLEIGAKTGDADDGKKPPVGTTNGAPPSLLYSGFIEAAGRRIAIINGMEYETGDRLPAGGFVLKAVRPNQVIVASPKGEVAIPLKETD